MAANFDVYLKVINSFKDSVQSSKYISFENDTMTKIPNKLHTRLKLVSWNLVTQY
jgi:hypothetical protein